MVARFLRSPALHFLCLGACLAAGTRLWQADAPAVGSDDELLYRSALALGVDVSDRAVRDRLARLGTFVGEDAADEATLADEARRLGLARSDVVVRRHLAQMMRLAAGRLLPEDIPTEAELASRAAALVVPERVRFAHVYVSRARHGDDTDTTARSLLEALRYDRVAPDDASRLGDPFVIGSEVGPITAADVDRRFGPGFAAGLDDAVPGKWVGPIASSYGLHLVWVRERIDATPPPLDAVRGQVLHGILRERREARARDRIAALRAR